jgi:hypothetical protein
MQRSEGTLWSDTKTPWEDLAKEDTERIKAWLEDVADNWSFMEKTVGFTEFGHLGNTYLPTGDNNEQLPWIPEVNIHKKNIFKNLQQPLGPADNTMTPVVKVERYKNWIRQMCNRGGYCYLILFQRKYRPYAFLLYGKNPQLGDLNLCEEYRSNVFMELNIAVNYPKKLIHVYLGFATGIPRVRFSHTVPVPAETVPVQPRVRFRRVRVRFFTKPAVYRTPAGTLLILKEQAVI